MLNAEREQSADAVSATVKLGMAYIEAAGSVLIAKGSVHSSSLTPAAQGRIWLYWVFCDAILVSQRMAV